VSVTPQEEAARAELRARQGKGARYDAPSAPAEDLLLARRGTAYFARKLNELTDSELDLPSRRPGVSRRHLVAFAGYQARMLAELVAWARESRTGPLPRCAEVEADEIDWGLTLPSHALRNLFQHAVVHLDVEWRDLSDQQWDRTVEDADGNEVAVRETPAMRAHTLWSLALDLNAGATIAHVPPELRRGLSRTPE
jgi:maleylpyruvate isomerase